MPAFISVRQSIRWRPAEASEPADVVVLTGGATGVFLDVRFLKRGADEEATLDWAFAGYRTSCVSRPGRCGSRC